MRNRTQNSDHLSSSLLEAHHVQRNFAAQGSSWLAQPSRQGRFILEKFHGCRIHLLIQVWNGFQTPPVASDCSLDGKFQASALA